VTIDSLPRRPNNSVSQQLFRFVFTRLVSSSQGF